MVADLSDIFLAASNSKFGHSLLKKLKLRKSGPAKLDKSEIRLVILEESDRGRVTFFDSKAIQEIKEPDKHNVTRSAPKAVRARPVNRELQGTQDKPKVKYQFHRLGQDVKMLEEMMYGTTPMTYKGSSLKVHQLKSPHHQLMVSKVFVPEKPRRESLGDLESDSSSLPNSSTDFSSEEFLTPIRKSKSKNNKSIPVDVPTKELFQECSTDDDSGLAASFTSSGSLRTPFPSPSNSSLSSYSSLHKRWMRAQTTTLDRRQTSDTSVIENGSIPRKRRKKIAIGILFAFTDENEEESVNLFQGFFFSHFALLEGHVEKLRAVVEKAYFNQRNFLPPVMEALSQFRNNIYDLYMAPRLSEPVWLSMMSSPTHRVKLTEKFMADFSWLVSKFDNKSCNFFVSTLLSAVLTQHLAWVATVTPSDGTPTRTYLEKHSAKWVDSLAKTHPYNPLWAQLGDLFGAIGQPLKISRTVVTGKKAEVVKRFLSILSYFIRCSNVHENGNIQTLCEIVTETDFDESFSPTVSEKTLLESAGLDGLPTPTSSNIFFNRQTSSVSSSRSSHSVTQRMKHKPPSEITESSAINVSENNTSTLTAEKGCFECSNNSRFSKHVKDLNNSVLQLKDLNCSPQEMKCLCKDVTNRTQPHDSLLCNFRKNSLEKNQSSFNSPSGDLDENSQQKVKCFNCSNVCNNQSCDFHSTKSTDHIQDKSHTVSSDSKSKDLYDFSSSPLSLKASHSPSLSKEHIEKEIAFGMSDLHIPKPNSIDPISITSAKIVESPNIENVQHVSRSTISPTMLPELAMNPDIIRSHSFSDSKRKSKLSQQLESSSDVKLEPAGKSKLADARKRFLESSSTSMFEDLFEPGVEAKTIDDLSAEEQQIIASSFVSTEPSQLIELPAIATSKTTFTRQVSQEAKPQLNRTTSIGRCRSITPTELSRRRHLSSTGSIDYETFDPMLHCNEIKLPSTPSDSGQWHLKAFERNFGRSLLASHTDHYMSDFVLHGTSDSSFRTKLLNDLQMAVQHSILDEPVEEAVCVIADTDKWTVEVASSKVISMSPTGCTPWTSSRLVADLIESVVELYRLKMSAEFCVMHLEDRLQEIYFKSLMLAEYLNEYLNVSTQVSQRELTSMLGFESSDMPLLLAIAGTHTPMMDLNSA